MNLLQIWCMTSASVIMGFFLDFLWGDPHWIYHPVRLIGRLISALEHILRKLFSATPKGERVAGIFLTVLTLSICVGAAGGISVAALHIHFILWLVLNTLYCYFLLAATSLKVESMQVYLALQKDDIPAARKALSYIVGRDTDTLKETEIIKATVETVAENTSDGVIAPLFYMMLGGPLLGWAYKAVNTLDSMVGYKNEQYRYFGTASARLDDILNYLPARIAAVLMVLASAVCKMRTGDAWRIWRRDHANHTSPNSAHTEAACAGALGIQLAGGASYFGQWKEKPFIGDSLYPPQRQNIPQSCRLMQITSLLGLLFFFIVKLLVLGAICFI